MPRLFVLLAMLSVAAGPPDFDKEIAPIFARRCTSCHGEKNQKGGLRLDRKKDAIAGGDSGTAIVPGKPDASALLNRVESADESERMPPKGERLTAGELKTIRTWIEQGAKWPDTASSTEDHWSFRPVVRPAIPG